MHILVTGGAGYIGSHMVRTLVSAGHNVIVLDTMEFGHRSALPSGVTVVQSEVANTAAADTIFSENPIEAVIHFAGYISVEESVADPKKYFHNNLIAPITLLESMEKHGVNKLIFSSTAAVYGNPQIVPIPEDHPKNPTSPYGLSKWCFEQYLALYEQKKTIHSISLRYFNASGASLDGNFGEAHTPETHIIPLGIKSAASKKEFFLFGNDYLTKDGSCVRDYIHIEDLCSAHSVALDALFSGHTSDIYNVGTGIGVTNKEVIAQIQKETGIEFPVVVKDRRPGDPAELIADPEKLKKELGWNPRYSDIATIVSTAWKWHRSHPKGYLDSKIVR